MVVADPQAEVLLQASPPVLELLAFALAFWVWEIWAVEVVVVAALRASPQVDCPLVRVLAGHKGDSHRSQREVAIQEKVADHWAAQRAEFPLAPVLAFVWAFLVWEI